MDHLLTFLTEYLFVLAALAGLAAIGGYVILPLSKNLPRSLALAPFAGMCWLAMSTLGLYAMGAQFKTAAAVGAATGLGLTGISVWLTRPHVEVRNVLLQCCGAAVLGAVVTGIVCTTTISMGSPSLLFTDGSDQGGYAQTADWLAGHPVTNTPTVEARDEYQSWPFSMFREDPRFGSFDMVATVSVVRGLGSLFSFDSTTAVALTVAILGAAAVFSRSKLGFLLLVIALLVSCWYDYSRSGYLGKVLGYPGTFMIVGLYMATEPRSWSSLTRTIPLLLFTCGAALMYPGMVASALTFVLGGAYLAFRAAFAYRPKWSEALPEIRQSALGLLLMSGAAFVTSGVMARPTPTGSPDFGVTWAYMVPRILDLENQGVTLSPLGDTGTTVAVAITLALLAGTFLLGLKQRNPAAAALTLAPAVFIGILVAHNEQASVFQLIGVIYPLGAAAAVAAAEGKPSFFPRIPRYLTVLGSTAALLLVAVHVPRMIGSVQRYAGSGVQPSAQYAMSDWDNMRSIIGCSVTLVDADDLHPAYFALIDLRLHGVSLRWTPRAWQFVVGYRNWPYPGHVDDASFELLPIADAPPGGAPVLYQTPQFRLIKLPSAPPAQQCGSAPTYIPAPEAPAIPE